MKKYLANFAILVMTFNFSFGQQEINWTTYFGSSNDDYVNQYYDHVMAKDNAGNILVAGYTNSTTGISNNGFQNLYGGGTYDAYLVKFNSNGTLLWSTYYGGSGDDQAYSVSTDNSGNIYLVGFTSSIANIASGGFQNTYGGGSNDAFIVKFNSDGNRIWSSYFGGESEDQAWGVTTDLNGNVFMCGNTVSNFSISSNGFQNIISGGGDSFLVKFDSVGNRIWSTYYGGMASEYGTCVITDISNNVYLGGYTNSTSGISSLGYQNTLAGDVDAFLVKFNPSGSRVWGSYFGGVGSDSGTSLSSDGSNIYFSGFTNSTSNIAQNGFQNSFGGGVIDAFIAKFSIAGSLSWSTYYGGQGEEYGVVSNDNSGNIILSGYTNSSDNISFGGFQDSIGGNNDLYFSIFDINGVQICSSYFGGINNEWGGHAISDNNEIYLVGFTNTTNGFVGGGFQSTYNGGNSDFLLAKVNSCAVTCSTTYSTTDIIHCGEYNWNSNNYQVSGVFQDTLQNINGCDSVATLNLTILDAPSALVTQDGFSLNANTVPGATYQWIYCSDLTLIPNQTFSQFAAETNGTYAVVVTDGCGSDTSDCYTISTIGLNELENNFSVYPNPTTSELTIYTYNLLVNSYFEIHDLNNRLIKSGDIMQNETKIDVSSFSKGVYIIKHDINKRLRFVKQ